MSQSSDKKHQKRHLRNFVPATVLSLTVAGLCGCSGYEAVVSTGQCFLRFDIATDNSFTSPDGTPLRPANADSDITDKPISLTLTELSTGATHTWDDVADFDVAEGYRAGNYRIEACLDPGTGYILKADTTITLTAGHLTDVGMTLRPAAAYFTTDITDANATCSLERIVAHTIGSGDFRDIVPGSIVTPGTVEFVASLSREDGKTVNLVMGDGLPVAAARYYASAATVNKDVICFDIDNRSQWQAKLTDALFDALPPEIADNGFESGIAMTVTEGLTLDHAVTMTATSGMPLQHIYISVESPVLSLVGMSSQQVSEVDLLNLSEQMKEQFDKSGITLDMSSDSTSATIGFTETIEEMASLTSARSTIRLWVVDALNRTSIPSSLVIDTRSVGFDVVSVSPAILGENTCQVTLRPTLPGIEMSDLHFYAISDNGRSECTVVENNELSDGSIQFKLDIPDGSEPTNIEVEYMGLKRTSFIVTRSIPEFKIAADGYATTVRMHIKTADTGSMAALTQSLLFFNGDTRCAILDRDIENGIITLTGLKPSTRYTFGACLTDLAILQTITFTTEAALDVPDGDFEDAVPSVFKYMSLPSGGRYAISPIDIPNRQNTVNIDFPWLKKYWASVNDRTFCTAASRHNTWYMQPSAEVVFDPKSGSKAMRLTSVGWDLDGEEIADYVPESATPVPTYSLSVPKVSHRSAGRLFLGKYAFDPSDMTELIEEGTPFTSRPSSLNGFYKFQPDQTVSSDRGSVSIRLVYRADGKDIVIAEGYATFGPAPDYTVFNVPLQYVNTDLRPTHLLLMFMSSSRGDSTPVDDISVPVTAFPDRGAMQGSVLWIDNLSFTY